MNESIFESMKKMLDLEETTSFDTDIMIHINGALDVLRQNGVGNPDVYVNSGTETWKDFMNEGSQCANIKTFVFARIKPYIDGTISGTYKDTLKQLENEALWRCRIVEDK